MAYAYKKICTNLAEKKRVDGKLPHPQKLVCVRAFKGAWLTDYCLSHMVQKYNYMCANYQSGSASRFYI
jgi:hypothetical protein